MRGWEGGGGGEREREKEKERKREAGQDACRGVLARERPRNTGGIRRDDSSRLPSRKSRSALRPRDAPPTKIDPVDRSGDCRQSGKLA